jgi:hypothetical protein
MKPINLKSSSLVATSDQIQESLFSNPGHGESGQETGNTQHKVWTKVYVPLKTGTNSLENKLYNGSQRQPTPDLHANQG